MHGVGCGTTVRSLSLSPPPKTALSPVACSLENRLGNANPLKAHMVPLLFLQWIPHWRIPSFCRKGMHQCHCYEGMEALPGVTAEISPGTSPARWAHNIQRLFQNHRMGCHAPWGPMLDACLHAEERARYLPALRCGSIWPG